MQQLKKKMWTNLKKAGFGFFRMKWSLMVFLMRNLMNTLFVRRMKWWKDFPQVTSYEEYRKITDKQHLSKAKSMPIKFLKTSGKGFFIDKDGYALGIRDELADVIKVDAFKKQMKDIIEYRTMEYYRRRYVEK